ncbi:hypothetical protein [Paenibacillus eucommiae]|uniref:Uncharacterized protein n=1 Tax=Paenibacillus eucommiae TaxID=1355755 RepID=A0ABS4IRG6_9BACL|nr:hypothetical protein [Paenibacillus eucommiae]MBP1990168.1 hypothetical protein [Paenibacillus eucommiae]
MKKIAIVWKDGVKDGSIAIQHAEIEHGEVLCGHGGYEPTNQKFYVNKPGELILTISKENTKLGAFSTIIAVQTEQHSFSFFLRDVSSDYPIYIREYGVIVTDAGNSHDYEQLVAEIVKKGILTKLQQIEAEPEESYEAAAVTTRALTCPIWLGLSRDVRIFEADFRGVGDSDDDRPWDCIRPRFHGQRVHIPETNESPVQYYYLLGRGLGCDYQVSRSLEERIYPIAHCTIQDDDIRYDNVAFASYEASPLHAQTIRGTHYLAADQYGIGFMFTAQQQAEYEQIAEQELNPQEETVYYSKTVATNDARVPRYAWFKNPFPGKLPCKFDGLSGFAMYPSDSVFAVSKLNGEPLPQEEVAVLLKPGESVTFEFYIPHRPISRLRAEQLRQQNFDIRHQECLNFWKSKLQQTTSVELPEPRIAEMMQAGFMHLDLISYGLESDPTLVPTIGVYTAIGSESSPIIQYLDSVGAHQLAERSLQFFLDKQHESGFIQNFGGYMLETGAALWSMGEHYRYVHDEAWISRIKPQLIKAYEYLSAWRNRNLLDELRGKGYGMLEGKTADPEDPFRSYMLNGFAYVGLKRLAEMLLLSDKSLSEKIDMEANGLKQDIVHSLRETMSQSPVVPLGDGSWVPTSAPWADYRGPVSLYADGGKWGTHGSMVARDSMLGPLYLVIQEVLQPNEEETTFLLQYHNELMCLHNVALSQPYYSIHPWIHLKRGETKAFLKAFYNGLAGLADRETYSFWEHYWHASPHKTHEEGWFLMQCRWMLYMEEQLTLRLLPGIPRAWLEQGKRISLRRAASYFGPFSMEIESDVNHGHGRITAHIEFHSDRIPETIEIRLPHPHSKRARSVSGGRYDADKETVHIQTTGSIMQVQVILEFA